MCVGVHCSDGSLKTESPSSSTSQPPASNAGFFLRGIGSRRQPKEVDQALWLGHRVDRSSLLRRPLRPFPNSGGWGVPYYHCCWYYHHRSYYSYYYHYDHCHIYYYYYSCTYIRTYMVSCLGVVDFPDFFGCSASSACPTLALLCCGGMDLGRNG